MTIDSVIAPMLDFVREHQGWAPAIVFVMALLESIVGLSLAIPSTPLFLGVGALIGASDMSFWPIFTGVALGGFVGDWISYWLGLRFKDRVLAWGERKGHAETIRKTQRIVEKWGVLAVFGGRFISPIRSFVPFAAGMFRMPQWKFQAANAASAVVWAYVLLAPAAALLRDYVG